MARPCRRRAPGAGDDAVISLMTSGGIALWVAALGTPAAHPVAERAGASGSRSARTGPSCTWPRRARPPWGAWPWSRRRRSGYLMGHAGTHVAFSRPGLLVIGVTVCAAVVGFLDDWIKVRHRRSLGLNKRAKLAAQVVIAVAFALLAEHWAGVNTHLSFTRWNSLGIDLGQVGWIVWAVVILVGTANAVNLTDGLDGLGLGLGHVLLRLPGRHRVLAVPSLLALPRVVGPRPGAGLGGPGRRLSRLPVVERGAGPDLHGRHGIARHRLGPGRAVACR